MIETWYMGTHMRVLSERYPMNTNMTGFRWFSLRHFALDKSSVSIRRVKLFLRNAEIKRGNQEYKSMY